MQWFQWAVIVVSVGLQVLVIAALLRGLYKTYPLVFTFMLALFLTTAADVAGLGPKGATAKEFSESY